MYFKFVMSIFIFTLSLSLSQPVHAVLMNYGGTGKFKHHNNHYSGGFTEHDVRAKICIDDQLPLDNENGAPLLLGQQWSDHAARDYTIHIAQASFFIEGLGAMHGDGYFSLTFKPKGWDSYNPSMHWFIWDVFFDLDFDGVSIVPNSGSFETSNGDGDLVFLHDEFPIEFGNILYMPLLEDWIGDWSDLDSLEGFSFSDLKLERVTSAPEPATLLLLSTGIIGLLGWKNKLNRGR